MLLNIWYRHVTIQGSCLQTASTWRSVYLVTHEYTQMNTCPLCMI